MSRNEAGINNRSSSGLENRTSESDRSAVGAFRRLTTTSEANIRPSVANRPSTVQPTSPSEGTPMRTKFPHDSRFSTRSRP